MTMRPIVLAAFAPAFAACAHGPPAARYQPTNDGWTHLCEPNRFVVDLPGAPEEGRKTLEGADGPLVAATWEAIQGRRVYDVEYVEYDDVERSPAEIVGIMRENTVKQGRVVDDRPQSGDGWASDDLLIETNGAEGPRSMQVRIVMSRQQLWLLITAAPSFEEDQASATRFLQSLRYRDAATECD